MKRNSPVSVVFIVLIVAVAIWFLYPSVTYYRMSPDERYKAVRENPSILKKVINMGLDLEGGMRIVLEVDRNALADKNDKGVIDRAYTIIENRINGLGVSEPTIQKQGNDRLIVELPGLKDASVAKNVIGSTAQLQFQLVREPEELNRAIRIIDKVLKGERDTSLADTTAKDTSALKQEQAQKQAEQIFTGTEKSDSAKDETAKDDPLAPKKAAFSDYLVAVGSQIGVRENDRPKVMDMLARKDVKDALKIAGLSSSTFLWAHSIEKQGAVEFRPLYYVKTKAELTGDIIKEAINDVSRGGMTEGQAIVTLELNREGARKFSRVTGANVNKFLAIVLDSTVYSAPVIRQKISQGHAQIEGNFTTEEAKGLAVVLQAGALPAPVKIIEERLVGPSLGQDSISLAIKSLIVSIIITLLFMMVYYKMSGVVAVAALILNNIFILALMASIGQTLTLPGIGGLILSFGMSVDANVIIYERIREELRFGKTIRSAIEAGYARAFLTVFDSNITTLFTTLILIWLGSASIRGFGVTMSMGIVISMFTSIFCTHVALDFITSSKNVKKLSI